MPIWQGRNVKTTIDKGYELMANQSLKAQIEAAKSALASDLVVPSLLAPPPKPPTTPVLAGNDITTGTGATDTGANAAAGIQADGKSAHATNAAALDGRITQLEAKLLDNQRDLHTLLQKIREVSSLQPNSSQSHKNPAKDQVVARRNKSSSVIIVAMAALIGLIVGIAYFLVTAKGDPSALTVPSWISTIINSFNG